MPAAGIPHINNLNKNPAGVIKMPMPNTARYADSKIIMMQGATMAFQTLRFITESPPKGPFDGTIITFCFMKINRWLDQ
jgi:hypothetical protein